MKQLSIQIIYTNKNFNELIFSNDSFQQDSDFREICLNIIKKLFENTHTITYCTNYNKQITKNGLFCKNTKFVDFDDNKTYAKHQKINKNTLITYTKGLNDVLLSEIFLDNYPLQIPFSMYGYKNQLNFEKIVNLDDTDYFLYCSYEECHDNLNIFYDKTLDLEKITDIIKTICENFDKELNINLR